MFILFSIVCLYFFLVPKKAYAYIDPGVGSLILQGIAAAFVSLMVFWQGFRNKIKFFITGKKKSKDKDND